MSSASYSYIDYIANISISSDFAIRKTTIFTMPPMLKPARRRDGDVTAPELPRTLTTPGRAQGPVEPGEEREQQVAEGEERGEDVGGTPSSSVSPSAANGRKRRSERLSQFQSQVLNMFDEAKKKRTESVDPEEEAFATLVLASIRRIAPKHRFTVKMQIMSMLDAAETSE